MEVHKPYIFAYSMLIDETIEVKALKHGFCKCIEGPLTYDKIKFEIFDFIERDKSAKKRMGSMSAISKSSADETESVRITKGDKPSCQQVIKSQFYHHQHSSITEDKASSIAYQTFGSRDLYQFSVPKVKSIKFEESKYSEFSEEK
jgi:hypothetical protein